MNNRVNLPKIKENIKNLKDFNLKPNSTFNQFHKNKTLFKNSSSIFKPNISMYGKNTSSFFNNNYDN